MSAPRKLPPEAEAAIIAWYSKYQKAMDRLRRLGTVPQKAKEYGVSVRGIHLIAKRDIEKIRRCLSDSQGSQQ